MKFLRYEIELKLRTRYYEVHHIGLWICAAAAKDSIQEFFYRVPDAQPDAQGTDSQRIYKYIFYYSLWSHWCSLVSYLTMESQRLGNSENSPKQTPLGYISLDRAGWNMFILVTKNNLYFVTKMCILSKSWSRGHRVLCIHK